MRLLQDPITTITTHKCFDSFHFTMNHSLLLNLFILFLLAACASYKSLEQIVAIQTASGNYSIRAEIAQTPAEQSNGLMYRDSLDENTGMLFVFERVEPVAFWMKNTRIPLDIIFVNASGSIVNIVTAQPCIEEPCEQYRSDGAVKYVLEVNGGYAARQGIRAGDIVVLQ